jgi:hypothetical protein
MGTYTIKVNGRELLTRHFDSSYTVQARAQEYSREHPNDVVQIFLHGIRFHQYKGGNEFWT